MKIVSIYSYNFYHLIKLSYKVVTVLFITLLNPESNVAPHPLHITTIPNFFLALKNIALYKPYAEPVCPHIISPGINLSEVSNASP